MAPGMQRDRWDLVEKLFHRALEQPATERQAFLERECKGDVALREEVLSLVRNFETAGSFMGAPVAAASSPTLREGKIIGSYRIVALLGKGGMGEVYLAEDSRLRRKVALKLPTTANAEELRRFFCEARAASALNHPHIVTVHDTGEIDGRPYIVTEYIEGLTLRQLLAKGPIPVDQAVQIALESASALSAAHAAGITHRDIKPENIMVRPDGYAKILDFGLAKGAATPDNLTSPGMLVGTPRYMSPEQVAGQPVDRRTDLWSLGVVLYEMLAGFRPFEGETPIGIALRILHDPPPPLPPAAGERLDRVVGRALAKEPGARYQDAAAFAGDLRGLASEHLREGAAAKPARPSLSIRPWIIAAGALAILSVSAALTYRYLTRDTWHFNIGDMRRVPVPANVGRSAISPDGKYVAYTVTRDSKQSVFIRQVGATAERELIPAEESRMGGLSFSPGSEYVYALSYGKTSIGLLRRIPVLQGESKVIVDNVDSSVSFSPDGRKLCFMRYIVDKSGDETELLIANPDGNEQRVVAKRKAPQEFLRETPAWSPDGSVIAIGLADRSTKPRPTVQVAFVDASSGQYKSIQVDAWWIGPIVWGPGGRSVILPFADQSPGGRLLQVSYPDGAARPLTNVLDNYAYVTATRDGRTLAAMTMQQFSDVWVQPVAPGAQPRKVTAEPDRYNGLSWTTGGQLLTQWLATGKPDLWLIDPETGRRQQVSDDEGLELQSTACGTANFAVFSSNRGGAWNLWKIGLDGRGLSQLTTGPGPDMNPSCSADGQTVAFTSSRDGTQQFWTVQTIGGPASQVTRNAVTQPAISPDGKRVAMQTANPSNRRWVTVIQPINGSDPSQVFESIPVNSPLRWGPGGSSVAYLIERNGVSNIWAQPLDGQPARRLTSFTEGRTLAFGWSVDGTKLATLRGATRTEIVLLSQKEFD